MCSAVEKFRRRGVEVVRSGKKSPAACGSRSEVENFRLRSGSGRKWKIFTCGADMVSVEKFHLRRGAEVARNFPKQLGHI